MKKIFTCLLLLTSLITAQAQSRQQDSLALVDLYNSTGGASWTNNTAWLTGPLDFWEGISLNNNRVTDIFLSSHNLTGVIPASIGNLTALEVLVLSGNNLSGSIPAEMGNLSQLFVLDLANNDLSGAVPASFDNLTLLSSLTLHNNNLSDIPAFINVWPNTLKVENNALTFEDIVPNADIAVTYTYAPQDSVGERIILQQAEGDLVVLSVVVGGEGNVYQWYKNDVILTGETASTLEIASVTAADYADYNLVITNPGAPDLTLYSHTITIVENIPTNVTSSLASVQVYPNPAIDHLLVKNSSGSEQLVLKDISGKVVKSMSAENGQTHIPLEDLGKGMYFLEVSSGNSKELYRIFKQ